MNNLKEMTIKSRKIFYFLFSMIFIVGGIGFTALSISSSNFEHFRERTSKSFLVSGLQRDLLFLRLSVKNYIQYEDEIYSEKFNQLQTKVTDKLNLAYKEAQSSSAKEKITNIENLFSSYQKHFKTFRGHLKNKRIILKRLDELHSSDLSLISNITDKGVYEKISANYWKLYAQANVLLSKNEVPTQLMFDEFSNNIDSINLKNDKNLISLKESIKVVSDEMINLAQLQIKIKDEIEKGLDLAGPKVANYLEKVANDLEKEENQIGSELVSKNLWYQGAVLFFSFLALAIAGTLVFSVLKNFKTIYESIVDISCSLNKNMEHVKKISIKTLETSTEVAEASITQASSIEESSQALEEMEGMTAMNLDAVKNSNELTMNMKSISDDAAHCINELAESMENITESNKEIEAFSEIIGEIANKTKLIDEIVFQTKILSFNASVEAERAGEHGKGFSVVAEEVGKLARNSGETAREIQDILDMSLKKVNEVVRSNNEKVENGNAVTKKTQTILDSIQLACDKVLGKNQDVLTASNEQAIGIKQINMAITSLDQTTHKTSLIAKQSNHVVLELEEEANELSDVVETLNQIIGSEASIAETESKKEHEIISINSVAA